MRFNNRAMALAGIPDLPSEAFKHDGNRKIKPQGSDSPPPAPSSQTVTQTSIPEYAKPYVERMLGKAEAVTSAPYQAYGGERIAGFSPMQQNAMQGIANLQPSQQLGTATQMAGQAGMDRPPHQGNARHDSFERCSGRRSEVAEKNAAGLCHQRNARDQG